MIILDGAALRGGGQVLRTALGLSAHTNKPFSFKNIRTTRPKPGLRPQHVAAVSALQRLTNAHVEGAYVGSTDVTFVPYGYTPSPIDIQIGTAGSTALILQALMIPAMHHKKTTYTVRGGTDTLYAPPADFTRYTLAPLAQEFGECNIEVKRRGFFPKGGGNLEATFGMHRNPKPLTLLARGTLHQITIMSVASHLLLDNQVLEDAERTLRVILDKYDCPLSFRNTYVHSADPGYSILIYATYTLDKQRALITGSALGDEADSAIEAAEMAAQRFSNRMDSQGVVDELLTDQIIPFLALHGGEVIATKISPHIKSNIGVCEAFLPVRFSIQGNHITVSRQV